MRLFDRLNKIKGRKPVVNEIEEGGQAAIVPGGRKIVSPMGECILLEKMYPESFKFPVRGSMILQANFRLLRGVGCVYEAQLKEQGYQYINQLADHPRWGDQARIVLNLINTSRVDKLRNLGACDWELLTFFQPEETVFLDIESTGLWASQPLFLVGILYKKSANLVSEQYFARHYGEEKAVLEAVDRVLKRFKVVVTYNGKRFDLPYIAGRFVAHRLFYQYEHYHVDLLYHARRHFKHLLPDCRLMTLEEYLLNFRREGDIPGYLIPQTYHKFVQTADFSLVEPILEHNRLDLLTMARLFHLADPMCAVPLAHTRDEAASSQNAVQNDSQ